MLVGNKHPISYYLWKSHIKSKSVNLVKAAVIKSIILTTNTSSEEQHIIGPKKEENHMLFLSRLYVQIGQNYKNVNILYLPENLQLIQKSSTYLAYIIH